MFLLGVRNFKFAKAPLFTVDFQKRAQGNVCTMVAALLFEA